MKVVLVTCKVTSLSLSATSQLNPCLSLPHRYLLYGTVRSSPAQLSCHLEDDQPPSLRGFHTTPFLLLREELGTHNQNTHHMPPALHLGFVRALGEQKGVSGAAGKGDLAVSVLVLPQGL